MQDDACETEVLGFERQVHVFDSKQFPKLLTLHCSDFRSRKFVVKGAEDLRIDARVEQLMDVMNGIAGGHAGCAARRLGVRTYAVVPVSPSCGLLGFVSGTRPLQVSERRVGMR